jgi:hypothetical protein
VRAEGIRGGFTSRGQRVNELNVKATLKDLVKLDAKLWDLAIM